MEIESNKMKVLFLDIDGVLNRFKLPYVEEVEDELIKNLKYVVKQTKCKIVISSTWKASKEMMKILEANLFPKLPKNCFIGCTPTVVPQVLREKEIIMWLNIHPGIDKWVVIDDYDFELQSLMEHCVITNALYGLTKEKANECIRKLNHD